MNPLASITSAKIHWKKTPPGASIFKKEYEVEKAGSAEYDGNVHGGVPMKFVHVTNENFEDIFGIVHKSEHIERKKHSVSESEPHNQTIDYHNLDDANTELYLSAA